jgi:hypothetical protein
MTTAEAGLPAVTAALNPDRVNVDPTRALSDKLDTNRSTVRYTPALQDPERHRLGARVQCQSRSRCKRVCRPTKASHPNLQRPRRSNLRNHITEVHAVAWTVGVHRYLRVDRCRRVIGRALLSRITLASRGESDGSLVPLISSV